jgi:hypothetical protein
LQSLQYVSVISEHDRFWNVPSAHVEHSVHTLSTFAEQGCEVNSLESQGVQSSDSRPSRAHPVCTNKNRSVTHDEELHKSHKVDKSQPAASNVRKVKRGEGSTPRF